MKRVLLTADAVGGVWTAVLDLAAGLTVAGLDVLIAVAGPSLTPAQARAAERKAVRVIELAGDLDWLAADRSGVERAALEFARCAERFEADLVHLHAPAYAALARYPAPVAVSAHSCVATWHEAVRGGPPPADLAWRAALTREGILAADAVLAPSASFARALARAYPETPPAQIVYNGREPHPVSRNALPAPFAVAVGRLWDSAKNAGAIDRAAQRLSRPLLAIGPLRGPHGEAATLAHAVALGPEPQERVRARLAERPVFVSAALYEPFGLAALEAAQAGCALVLSDIETHRELWTGAALFVPPDDDAAIARAIERCFAEPSLRRSLGLAASRRSSRYRLAGHVDAVRALYASLTSAAALEAAP